MARAYSLDLRRRVIEAINCGLSTRAAAARFSIGIATAGAWHRHWRRAGNIEPGRQGQPPGSKLDVHEVFILALIDKTKDITLAEIADRVADRHGLRVCPSTVWHFLSKRGITYKKRQRTHPNNSERMSRPLARRGSTGSSISIPSD